MEQYLCRKLKNQLSGGNLMKRKAALILALLMASQCFLTSCSNKEEEAETPKQSVSENTGSTDSSDTAEETEVQTEAETDIYASLTPKNYDGYTFAFSIEGQAYGTTEMDFEEMTGDIIVDTIFTRNRAIEDILNIVITQEYGAAEGRLKDMHMAGDDIYDVVWLAINQMDTMKREYLFDFYEIEDINWDDPWWEEATRKDYETGTKLFFAQSPMNLHFYESLIPILFNKEIANQYQIENLYTAVSEGRWTLDMMAEVSTSVITDKDGDSIIDASKDIVGYAASTNLVPFMTVAAGARYSEKGENGVPVFLGLTERLQSSVEKIAKTFSVSDNVVAYGDYIRLFSENHAMFFLDCLGRVKDLRETEFDFGILPLPKYDESQEEYISSFVGYADCMVIPSANREAAEIGTILTYFSAYSYRDLIPAFYEKSVTGKQFRDQESVEMLEIMLSNIRMEPALLFEWCGMLGLIEKAAQSNGEGLAAKFQAMEKAMATTIDRMYGKYVN